MQFGGFLRPSRKKGTQQLVSRRGGLQLTVPSPWATGLELSNTPRRRSP